MRTLSIIYLLICTLALSACGITETKTFRSTSEFYYTYVNSPAIIEVTKVDVSDQDAFLAQNLLLIDLATTSFIRDFAKFTYVPSPSEIQSLARNYSWITGIALLNAEGDIVSQEPSYNIKNLDFKALVGKQSELGSRAMFTEVLSSDLGNEITLTLPLYNNSNLIAYLVAYFDPQSLAKVTNNPTNIVLASQGKLLYAANPSLIDASAFLTRSNNNFAGKLSSQNTDITWQTSFIGNKPLVVATVLN